MIYIYTYICNKRESEFERVRGNKGGFGRRKRRGNDVIVLQSQKIRGIILKRTMSIPANVRLYTLVCCFMGVFYSNEQISL